MGQILDLVRGDMLASGLWFKIGSGLDVSERITAQSPSCVLAQIEAGGGGIGAI